MGVAQMVMWILKVSLTAVLWTPRLMWGLQEHHTSMV